MVSDGPAASRTQNKSGRSVLFVKRFLVMCFPAPAAASLWWSSDRWCFHALLVSVGTALVSWQVPADLLLSASFGEILIHPSLEIAAVRFIDDLVARRCRMETGRVAFCLCPSDVPQGQSVCLCSLLLLIRMFWHQFTTSFIILASLIQTANVICIEGWSSSARGDVPCVK